MCIYGILYVRSSGIYAINIHRSYTTLKYSVRARQPLKRNNIILKYWPSFFLFFLIIPALGLLHKNKVRNCQEEDHRNADCLLKNTSNKHKYILKDVRFREIAFDLSFVLYHNDLLS
jgi:hypothetical protein